MFYPGPVLREQTRPVLPVRTDLGAPNKRHINNPHRRTRPNVAHSQSSLFDDIGVAVVQEDSKLVDTPVVRANAAVTKIETEQVRICASSRSAPSQSGQSLLRGQPPGLRPRWRQSRIVHRGIPVRRAIWQSFRPHAIQRVTSSHSSADRTAPPKSTCFRNGSEGVRHLSGPAAKGAGWPPIGSSARFRQLMAQSDVSYPGSTKCWLEAPCEVRKRRAKSGSAVRSLEAPCEVWKRRAKSGSAVRSLERLTRRIRPEGRTRWRSSVRAAGRRLWPGPAAFLNPDLAHLASSLVGLELLLFPSAWMPLR